jgi:hypothetical protein
MIESCGLWAAWATSGVIDAAWPGAKSGFGHLRRHPRSVVTYAHPQAASHHTSTPTTLRGDQRSDPRRTSPHTGPPPLRGDERPNPHHRSPHRAGRDERDATRADGQRGGQRSDPHHRSPHTGAHHRSVVTSGPIHTTDHHTPSGTRHERDATRAGRGGVVGSGPRLVGRCRADGRGWAGERGPGGAALPDPGQGVMVAMARADTSTTSMASSWVSVAARRVRASVGSETGEPAASGSRCRVTCAPSR